MTDKAPLDWALPDKPVSLPWLAVVLLPGLARIFHEKRAGRTEPCRCAFVSGSSGLPNSGAKKQIAFRPRKKMKGSACGNVEFIMNVRWKLKKALLVGIVLVATCFQGVILAADTAQKSLVRHARITRAQAERMALGRVPGGSLQHAKLLRENGELIWSVDILTPLTRKVAAVQIDAYSGQVLSKLAQNPADRAEESVAD
jgi:hypothetical protein